MSSSPPMRGRRGWERRLAERETPLGQPSVERPAFDSAEHGDHEFRPDALGQRHERLVVAGDDLCDAVPIADVDEHQRAEIPDPVDPPEQDHVLAHVLDREGAAGVRARERAERLVHDPVLPERRIQPATSPRGTDVCSPVSMFLIVT